MTRFPAPKRIIFLLIFLTSFRVLQSQTTIEIQADQPEKLAVTGTVFYDFGDRSVIFGTGLDITGGTKPYAYSWFVDNLLTGSDSVFVAKPYAGYKSYVLEVTDKHNCKSVIPMPVVTDAPYGIADVFESGGLTVYPIPAKDFLIVSGEITGEKLNITLYDSKGVPVLTKQINGESRLDFDLPSGTYFIKISTQGGKLSTVKKIMILK